MQEFKEGDAQAARANRSESPETHPIERAQAASIKFRFAFAKGADPASPSCFRGFLFLLELRQLLELLELLCLLFAICYLLF